MRFDGIHPAQNWTFVIRRTSAKHSALIINAERKWFCCPSVLFQRRLYIVVSVHKNRSLLGIITVPPKYHWRKIQVFFVRLLAQFSQFYMGT